MSNLVSDSVGDSTPVRSRGSACRSFPTPVHPANRSTALWSPSRDDRGLVQRFLPDMRKSPTITSSVKPETGASSAHTSSGEGNQSGASGSLPSAPERICEPVTPRLIGGLIGLTAPTSSLLSVLCTNLPRGSPSSLAAVRRVKNWPGVRQSATEATRVSKAFGSTPGAVTTPWVDLSTSFV